MFDVAAAVLLGYCFFFILGLGAAYLLLGSRERLLSTFCLAPTVGFALTSLATFLLVRCDWPVGHWARLWLVLGGAASLLAFAAARRFSGREEAAFDWRFAGLFTSAVVFAGAVACYPILIGGMAFTTFRGNSCDAGAYIAMAEYYQTETYSYGQGATAEELFVKHPIFPHRIREGRHCPRWVSCATLAWLSSATGVDNYRVFPGQMLLCLLLGVGPILWLARMGRLPAVATWLLGVVFVVGFWGQVLVDTAALSNLDVIAFLLAAACCLTQLELKMSLCGWREAALLALLGVALVLQYAEMVPFFVLALLLWFPLAVWRGWASWGWRWDLAGAVGATLVSILVTFAVYPPLLDFVHGQVAFSTAVITHNWWIGYYSYIFNSPLHGVPGLSTFAQFDGDSATVLRNLPTQILGVCFWSAFLLGAGWHLLARGDKRPVNRSVGVFAFVFALVAVYFLARDHRWPAAKAVCYGYPFVLCCVVFASAHLAVWLWQRPGLRWLGVGVSVVLTAYLGIQLLVAKQRIHYAKENSDMPNFVCNYQEYRRYDLDATAFRSRHTPLPEDVTCAVAIADSWLAEYYTNVLRPRVHVECRSPVAESGHWVGGRPPPQVPALPDFALVQTDIAHTMKARGYRLLAANRDVALLDLRSADADTPQVLWVWEPCEQSDELHETWLCILARTDGVCELPTTTIQPPDTAQREQRYSTLTMWLSGYPGEHTVGMLKDIGDHFAIPVRKGLNTVLVQQWRPRQ